MKNYIVDITRQELTQEHVKVYESVYENVWKESEPTYFGPDIHPAIEFSHFDLVPINQTISQIHRTGGLANATIADEDELELSNGSSRFHVCVAVTNY